MRVLHVIDSLDPAAGGPAEGTRQLTIALQALGQESEVVSLDAPGAPSCLAGESIRVHALGPSHMTYSYNSKLLPWLRTNASSYDVVLVHGIWQYHSFAAWRALRGSATPYLIYPHGMLDPWFKRTYPLKHLKKWLYWPWGVYPVLRDARATLFTCEEERIQARDSFWLYKCHERVIDYGTAGSPNDPETEIAAFHARFPGLRNKRLLVFLSRVHPKKGCDLLIEAFAKALAERPDWHLLMAGPDQVGWRTELMAEAERLGVSQKITWAGMITGDVKWGALRAADAFVLPSHHENFGVVVAEALSCGTPVLISNKINIWREIKDSGAGLVENDDLPGTVKLLSSWAAMSDSERQRIRNSARACFERHFEIGSAAVRFLKLLSEVQREALA